uniref:AP-5 complex subunit beta-1 n=1 Tax=Myxine glutinosa TaxID=7769 RepID=UPI00358F9FFA
MAGWRTYSPVPQLSFCDEISLEPKEILYILQDENEATDRKLACLGLIQEFPEELAAESLHEAIAILLSLIPSHSDAVSSRLSVHAVLALTTLLGGCCGEENNEIQIQGLDEFLELLFGVVEDCRRSKDDLRNAALASLHELETCFPGLLSGKLDRLGFAASIPLGVDTLPILTRTLQHMIQKHGANFRDYSLHDDQPPNLLTSMIISPFSPPVDSIVSSMTEPDARELRATIVKAIEYLYYLPTAQQLTTVMDLALFVHSCGPSIPPAVFKPLLPRLIASPFLQLQESALVLKATFGETLFLAEDEGVLVKRTLALSVHPLIAPEICLSAAHRVLHFPENLPLCGTDTCHVPVSLTTTMVAPLFPSVFLGCPPVIPDAPLAPIRQSLLLARLHILAIVLTENSSDIQGPKMMFHCLEAMAATLQPSNNQLVETFFLAAELFYHCFGDSDAVSSNMEYLLLGLHKQNACWVKPIVSFLNWMIAEKPQNACPLNILRTLQNEILHGQFLDSSPLEGLAILTRVAEEPSMDQHAILALLASSQLCITNDWLTGHALLAVCHAVMVQCDSAHLGVPLTNLLKCIAEEHGDLDVQDRARTYLALIRGVSSKKLSRMLSPGTVTDAEHPWSSPVTVGNLSALSDIIVLSETVLELVADVTGENNFGQICNFESKDGAHELVNIINSEIEENRKIDELKVQNEKKVILCESPIDHYDDRDGKCDGEESDPFRLETECKKNDDEDEKKKVSSNDIQNLHSFCIQNGVSMDTFDDAVAMYYASREAGVLPSTIMLRFWLRYNMSASAVPVHLQRLCAIELRLSAGPNLGAISPEPIVPYIGADEPLGQLVTLRVKPSQPRPSVLRGEALFCDSEGRTCSCLLPPVDIAFCSLCLPLPVPSALRGAIFDALWDEFLAAPEEGDCAESLFCCKLNDTGLDSLVNNRFGHFVVKVLEAQYDIGIFLPPGNHVLLRCTQLGATVKISIVTDCWQLLPFICSFLAESTKT